MRRALAASAALVALALAPSARADDVEQSNQAMFGVAFAYVPKQNALQGDVTALGHYVAYSHRFEVFFVGVRAALFYGWPASQWTLGGDLFAGAHLAIGKRFALRFEAGTGPLLNGGDGFATSGIDHTYVRATAQLTVVETVAVEAFGGPSFLIGPTAVGVYPELGLGVGWGF